MKTFNLPVSDCGCFVVGAIDGTTVDSMNTPEKKMPEFGVIVWYETEEAANAAFKAATQAHWDSERPTTTELASNKREAI